MPDIGASSHFTLDSLNLGVEGSNGSIGKCTVSGIIEINMIADDCHPLKGLLH